VSECFVCLSGIEMGTVRENEDKWDKHVRNH
jgi:hypothetical protein